MPASRGGITSPPGQARIVVLVAELHLFGGQLMVQENGSENCGSHQGSGRQVDDARIPVVPWVLPARPGVLGPLSKLPSALQKKDFPFIPSLRRVGGSIVLS